MFRSDQFHYTDPNPKPNPNPSSSLGPLFPFLSCRGCPLLCQLCLFFTEVLMTALQGVAFVPLVSGVVLSDFQHFCLVPAAICPTNDAKITSTKQTSCTGQRQRRDRDRQQRVAETPEKRRRILVGLTEYRQRRKEAETAEQGDRGRDSNKEHTQLVTALCTLFAVLRSEDLPPQCFTSPQY